MKVLTRYDKFNDGVGISGVSKTEPGLTTPLSVLFERFKSGKDVPTLSGMVNQSVPYINSFDSDIAEKYLQSQSLTKQLNELRDKVDKAPTA